MMMSDLPGDLLEEILCLVPATSLKQLRSTCKRWNLLFKDSRFARKHFVKASKQFLNLVLKNFRVCSMSVNLLEIPFIEVTGELLSPSDPYPNLPQTDIEKASHCDGLLLCTINEETRIVVWNPCTGQTKWIQTRIRYKRLGGDTYTLGSYQDSKSRSNSYKILSISGCYNQDQKFQIYEINSNSWRILDVPPDCSLYNCHGGVSLKGKTYWFGSDDEKEYIFLVSFDYTTERFERLPLPYQFPYVSFPNMALALVREEKLSVLLRPTHTFRKEIWVTNKIDETKAVLWNKVLTVDDPEKVRFLGLRSFLVDEEKKVLVCCERWHSYAKMCHIFRDMVYVVGEDNKLLTQVGFGGTICWPHLFLYVPSLIQIQ